MVVEVATVDETLDGLGLAFELARVVGGAGTRPK